MAELADAHDLGSCPARGGGSSPLRPTNLFGHILAILQVTIGNVLLQTTPHRNMKSLVFIRFFCRFSGDFALAHFRGEALNLHGF